MIFIEIYQVQFNNVVNYLIHVRGRNNIQRRVFL